MSPPPLTAVFAELPDPRRETENKLHALTDILAIATCAVIGGAESRDGIAVFGRAKEPFFRRFLKLANGIPSPDTFERVFAKLDPKRSRRRSGGGWRGRARPPGWCPSPSTASRSAGRRRRPLLAACTWSARGRPTPG